MIAAVFLMQSLGQLAAYAFGLAILKGLSDYRGLSPTETNYEVASPVIDIVWRTTIGIGAFPALVSLILRRIIPETPQYLVTKGELVGAVKAVRHVIPINPTLQPVDQTGLAAPRRSIDTPIPDFGNRRTSWWTSVVKYIYEVREHLAEKGRWRALLGVMITWYLLDLAYCMCFLGLFISPL